VLHDITLVQIALAVFGIGFLIAFHELGHYAAARLLGMRVLRYSLGFGPQVLRFRRHDIEYQLAALPFGGFVQIAGMSSLDEAATDDPMSYLNAPRWKRWLVLAAGPGFNYVAAVFFFFVFFIGWPSPTSAPTLELVEVHEGPAKEAGLVRGEFITAVNGVAVEGDGAFRRSIVESGGAPLVLSVLHVGDDGVAAREVTVVPARTEGGFRLGVAPAMRWPTAGVVPTLLASIENAWLETTRTLSALAALVRREPGVDVGGPVAIVADMKDKIALGLRYYVRILAVLSVSLGIFNLLPIPGLDGIKMLFLTVEGVVRRNINHKAQEMVNAVGVLLLLVLMAGLTLRDGLRLFS
jgi:regulator of sigma E protease